MDYYAYLDRKRKWEAIACSLLTSANDFGFHISIYDAANSIHPDASQSICIWRTSSTSYIIMESTQVHLPRGNGHRQTRRWKTTAKITLSTLERPTHFARSTTVTIWFILFVYSYPFISREPSLVTFISRICHFLHGISTVAPLDYPVALF